MKKTLFILLMCAYVMNAMAQSGWQYDTPNDNPLIVSSPEYFSGYDSDATYLGIMVGDSNGKNMVLIGLYGEKEIHDFRDNQQYVVVSFDWGKDVKWKIKQVEAGSKFQYFVIVNADNFIQHLRTANHIAISLPVYKVGIKTFHFSTGGYPLDW